MYLKHLLFLYTAVLLLLKVKQLRLGKPLLKQLNLFLVFLSQFLKGLLLFSFELILKLQYIPEILDSYL